MPVTITSLWARARKDRVPQVDSHSLGKLSPLSQSVPCPQHLSLAASRSPSTHPHMPPHLETVEMLPALLIPGNGSCLATAELLDFCRNAVARAPRTI